LSEWGSAIRQECSTFERRLCRRNRFMGGGLWRGPFQAPSLKIGSPGRTRTCNLVVTSAPAFLPGSDYLFTRLDPAIKLRVSGAVEALLDGLLSL